MIRVAIFADIHGKFLLPFKMVDAYQKHTGKSIDLILQCGDLGAFPEKSRLDKATLRHAKRDRDELGFMDEFKFVHPDIAEFLQDLNIDMLCVRGNHEDHEFLDDLEKDAEAINHHAYPIDAYNKVWMCRSGKPLTFYRTESNAKNSFSVSLFTDWQRVQNKHRKESINNLEALSVVGIGRIGDFKNRNHSQFIQDYERQALKKLAGFKQDFDILLTHDKASSSHRGYGSIDIASTLNQVVFAYHFYGHTGEPFSQVVDANGITQSVKVKELEFDKQGQLETGCMLILEKSDETFDLSVAPDPIIQNHSKHNWRYL